MVPFMVADCVILISMRYIDKGMKAEQKLNELEEKQAEQNRAMKKNEKFAQKAQYHEQQHAARKTKNQQYGSKKGGGGGGNNKNHGGVTTKNKKSNYNIGGNSKGSLK